METPDKKVLLDLDAEEALLLHNMLFDYLPRGELYGRLLERLRRLLEERERGVATSSEAAAADYLRATHSHVIILRKGENLLNHGRRLLKEDYESDVSGLADNVLDAIKDGEVRSTDELWDRVREECASSSRCSTKAESLAGLFVTDSDVDNEEIAAMSRRDGIPWDSLMCAAMIQDVRKEVEGRGISFDNRRVTIDEDDLWWELEPDPQAVLDTKGECCREAVLKHPRVAREDVQDYLDEFVSYARRDLGLPDPDDEEDAADGDADDGAGGATEG